MQKGLSATEHQLLRKFKIKVEMADFGDWHKIGKAHFREETNNLQRNYGRAGHSCGHFDSDHLLALGAG